MNVFLRAGVALASVLLAGVALAAPAVDQVDSFTAGDAAGWSTGGDNVGAVADAGPAGDGDAALEVVSDGSGQGGHIAVFNQAARWTGDWAAAGVSQLRVDLKNTSAVPLAVRIKLERGPAMETDYVVSAAQTVPADGAWSSYTFDVGVAGLSGPADPASALANVVRLWIQHDPDGIHPPDAQAGALLIDNITALGGTCGDGLKGPDELCDGDDVGAAACADLPGFDGGVLSCDASSDCEAYDTSLCTSCGDGVCEAAETAATCPDDCTTCGDGLCTGEETPASCPADCAAVCGDGFVSGDEECDWGTAGALRDVFASSPLLLSLGGLAVHAGDAIAYLSDPAQEVIHRIDAVTGAFIDSAPFIDTLGGAPVDVGISPDGDLFVISKANNRVEAYDRGDGSYISAFPLGGGLTRPEAIAFMPERSRVFVASDRDDAGLLQPIKQMDLVTGLMIGDFGAAVGDNDVAFGPGGDLFTVQGATIARYDGEDGTELGTWIDASATLDEILRFTFIADGRVFVLGPAGGEPTLVKYDASGQLVGVFGAGAVGPGAGLAVGPGGRLLGPGVDPSPDRVVAVARFETGNSDDTADSCREDCRDPRCGDGAVDSGEACDDGDDDDGDGCSGCSLDAGWVCDTAIVPNTCAQTCGDAALDAHEACDDGNAVDGDGCTASCAVEVGWACTAPSGGVGSSCAAEACGDGVIAGDEECEDRNTLSADGCSGCRLDDGWVCDTSVTPNLCASTCGDGGPDALEACDDGDADDGDGCSANCVIEPGWQCTAALDGAASICVAADCGDGLTVDEEECDDGDDVPGDGCTACAVDDGWVCDGVTDAPSTCSQTCGNSQADPLEACDDGNADDGDGCSANCALETGWSCTTAGASASVCGAASCGDGITVGDEECDDGDFHPNDGCTACTIDDGWVCRTAFVPAACFETCGDGGPDLYEACDDGGVEDGDGCSANCAVEPGWRCTAATLQAPSTCEAADCGDGIITGGERCDDGNTAQGDGCDASCAQEPGWVCDPATAPSDCFATCGDGHGDALEECDDGNTAQGDGCSASCAEEPGWSCTAAPSVCEAAACGDLIIAGDEECEDGDAVPGDGCTGCEIDDGWVCDAATLPSPCWPTCGDGSLGAFEACDDTNTQDGDGCSANCVIEAGWTCADAQCHATECGDGVAVADEECDDANTAAGDGCDDCALEDGWVCEILATPSACADTCGDGVADPLEACDDANAVGGDGCSANCVVEHGWACTAATASEPSTCSAAACGDDQVVGDETCDDGNEDPGDGCDASCLVEDGWACEGGADCAPICGDGKRYGDEACDDGDDTDGDGCSGCAIDEGWSCSDALGQTSECAEIAVCGDGKRGADEDCEDGNTDPGDGCSPQCEVEPDWACGADGCAPRDDDEDGLTNIEERQLGTGVDDPDSDDDGLDDGAEVEAGTLPLVADSDDDGLLDGFEVDSGYDPLSANSDDDTFEDADDNCPAVTNQDQADLDEDGVGDACDPTPGERDPHSVYGGEGCHGGGSAPAGLLLLLGLAAALRAARKRGHGPCRPRHG